ncbi:MAG TPA: ABC transporter substrate-binding protein [Candidatus Hydrogenedentes bacterium]|nr:ABC transporter substrate-binding protein [Candidatus Hydrogenedentota bacterium]HQH51419.1 ABC transporter substrate-binding protein [Candidatus Hydrogenedentota bacterium]
MRRITLGLLAVALVLGCGGQSAQPAASGGGGAEGAKYTIAVIPKGTTHDFWLTVKAGAEDAAKEFNAKTYWKGPDKETEVVKQLNIIEDFITMEVDAIVMAACDENAMIDVVKRAKDAGIPVVTIDSGVKSGDPVTFVATDNVAGAKAAGNELARLIGGKGEVGLIPFVKGAATSEMREQGFKEALAEFPEIKLVSTLYSESDAAKGMNVTQDMITANPNLAGIFAANEGGAIGAAQAIRADGKVGAIKLVAFDASDEEIAALKEGVIQALVVQNPYKMGYEGVKAAVDHLEGRPVEKRIDTGVTVVTMENFGQPDVQKVLYPLGQK